jgi:hypothetical protein
VRIRAASVLLYDSATLVFALSDRGMFICRHADVRGTFSRNRNLIPRAVSSGVDTAVTDTVGHSQTDPGDLYERTSRFSSQISGHL